MNELPDSSTGGGASRQAGGEAQSPAVRAGELLRQTREAHGLHVDAMAFSLKVPVAKLMALEAGRLELLPDLTFARGLAASICRNLKVDPAPVLELMPRTASARLGSDGPIINTPFRPPGSGPNFSVRGRMFSPAVLAVVVLLVGAALLVVWPKMHEDTATVTGEAAPPLMSDPTARPADAAASVAAAAPATPNTANTGATAITQVIPSAPAAPGLPAMSASSAAGPAAPLAVPAGGAASA